MTLDKLVLFCSLSCRWNLMKSLTEDSIFALQFLRKMFMNNSTKARFYFKKARRFHWFFSTAHSFPVPRYSELCLPQYRVEECRWKYRTTAMLLLSCCWCSAKHAGEGERRKDSVGFLISYGRRAISLKLCQQGRKSLDTKVERVRQKEEGRQTR